MEDDEDDLYGNTAVPVKNENALSNGSAEEQAMQEAAKEDEEEGEELDESDSVRLS